MGFTPIVAMTHAAEDLLDRLRQGKMEVSLELIDILLAVTDQSQGDAVSSGATAGNLCRI